MKRRATNQAEKADLVEEVVDLTVNNQAKKEKIEHVAEPYWIISLFSDMPLDYFKLVNRVIESNPNLDRTLTMKLVVEYVWSMHIKKRELDWYSDKFLFGNRIDCIWRTHLEDTIDYTQFCGSKFIHRKPISLSESNTEAINKQYVDFRAAYSKAYPHRVAALHVHGFSDPAYVAPPTASPTALSVAAAPIHVLAPPVETVRIQPKKTESPSERLISMGEVIKVFAVSSAGNKYEFLVAAKARVELLRQSIAQHVSVNVERIVVIFHSKELEDGTRLLDYGVKHLSTVAFQDRQSR